MRLAVSRAVVRRSTFLTCYQRHMWPHRQDEGPESHGLRARGRPSVTSILRELPRPPDKLPSSAHPARRERTTSPFRISNVLICSVILYILLV